MSLEQKRYLLDVIRGYNFAYMSTKNEGYKVVRDKLLDELTREIWGDNVIQLRAA